jgi:hypothetical protein
MIVRLVEAAKRDLLLKAGSGDWASIRELIWIIPSESEVKSVP